MNKITSGNGQKGLPQAPDREDRTGAAAGSGFRSSIEQSRHAAEAQERHERAPLPVGREEPRKRRKPPVFETLETVPFEEAVEVLRRRMGLPRQAPAPSVEELPQTAIAVIAREGDGATADAPLLAYSTIFMDGRQYTRWRSGTDPALDREVSKMLSEMTLGTGDK